MIVHCPLHSRAYFHVAPADYTIGNPLYSREYMLSRGIPFREKWDFENMNPFDETVVSMHESVEEAREFVRFYEPNGQIIVVCVPDYVQVVRNAEGYPSIPGFIPGDWIQGRVR